MKKKILTMGLALITLLLPGQPGVVNDNLSQVDWQLNGLSEGVILRYANDSLFSSVQAIYVVDVDTSAADFEFGVSVPDSRMTTSEIAGEGSNGVVNRPSGKVQRPVPGILFVRHADDYCNR